MLLLLPSPLVQAPVDAKAFGNWHFQPATSFPAPDSLTFQIVVKNLAGGAHKESDGTLREGTGTIRTQQVTTGPYPKLEIKYEGTEPGGQQFAWQAVLEAKTLQPWGYTRTFTDERGTERFELTFADGTITAALQQINGETVNRTLPNVGRYTLLPLLLLAGRGLEFEEGNLFTTPMLDPGALSFITPVITVKEREVIPVPAGLYECWKVEFKLGREVEHAWYAVKDPRIIAQYETSTRLWRLKQHAIPGPTKPKPAPKPKPKPVMGPPLPPG